MQMSLPPWERGLKLEAHNCQWKTTDVAPPVGAWIEITSDFQGKMVCISSLPPWERGLKYLYALLLQSPTGVAPPVGAWIEILYDKLTFCNRMVAPPVGAWIEILKSSYLA